MKFAPVLALLTLAACAASPLPEAVRESPPMPAIPPKDACEAGPLQWLVGKSKSEIPANAGGANRRITCSTCAVTMDYSPTRLNIVFDSETGIIREVKCG